MVLKYPKKRTKNSMVLILPMIPMIGIGSILRSISKSQNLTDNLYNSLQITLRCKTPSTKDRNLWPHGRILEVMMPSADLVYF